MNAQNSFKIAFTALTDSNAQSFYIESIINFAIVTLEFAADIFEAGQKVRSFMDQFIEDQQFTPIALLPAALEATEIPSPWETSTEVEVVEAEIVEAPQLNPSTPLLLSASTFIDYPSLTVKELRKIAKTFGHKVSKMTKTQLLEVLIA